MGLVLGLNITFKTPIHALHRRPGFKISDCKSQDCSVSRKEIQHMNMGISWLWKKCVHSNRNHTQCLLWSGCWPVSLLTALQIWIYMERVDKGIVRSTHQTSQKIYRMLSDNLLVCFTSYRKMYVPTFFYVGSRVTSITRSLTCYQLHLTEICLYIYHYNSFVVFLLWIYKILKCNWMSFVPHKVPCP